MSQRVEGSQADQPTQLVEIASGGDAGGRRREDRVATEEPLEIQVVTEQDQLWIHHNIAITMRTPGKDFELAAGFLFCENVIKDTSWIERIDHGRDDSGNPICNRVLVFLKPGSPFDPARLTRHVFTSSSCGICGKITIDQVRSAAVYAPRGTDAISQDLLMLLPDRLQEQQTLFHATGGLHASALFDIRGGLLLIREDVGRHNALDKLIGALLLEDRLPAANTVLLVSGRASFELVQKAALAGIPTLAAVGAPSSLAIELAREFGMTLVGFLRRNRYNIYCHGQRITGET